MFDKFRFRQINHPLINSVVYWSDLFSSVLARVNFYGKLESSINRYFFTFRCHNKYSLFIIFGRCGNHVRIQSTICKAKNVSYLAFLSFTSITNFITKMLILYLTNFRLNSALFFSLKVTLSIKHINSYCFNSNFSLHVCQVQTLPRV